MLNTTDCNKNFNTFLSILSDTMDKHAPLKTVKISGKRKFCEPWMTTGIETASRKTRQLYKEILKPNTSNKTIARYKHL